jgi:hypothetical protein
MPLRLEITCDVTADLCRSVTERLGGVVNTPASSSEGSRFESQLGEQLSCLLFRGFPQSTQANSEIVP